MCRRRKSQTNIDNLIATHLTFFVVIPIQKILATIIDVEFVRLNIVDGASLDRLFASFGILSMATHPTNIVALICQIGITIGCVRDKIVSLVSKHSALTHPTIIQMVWIVISRKPGLLNKTGFFGDLSRLKLTLF